MISIPLWQTPEHPCSYLPGKSARSLFVQSEFALDTDIYAALLAQGFRRSGDHVYKPNCEGCTACIPVRITVADFAANRQQRRCQQRNAATQVTIKPAQFEETQFALYQRYQLARHADGAMATVNADDYQRFLGSSWCNTRFVEFAVDGRLIAVAVVDVLGRALSAVYTFFDPDYSAYSPGVFAVLWQIEHARKLGLEHVYLGFWIEQCPKMSYKQHYRPLSGLIDRQWQPLTE